MTVLIHDACMVQTMCARNLGGSYVEVCVVLRVREERRFVSGSTKNVHPEISRSSQHEIHASAYASMGAGSRVRVLRRSLAANR